MIEAERKQRNELKTQELHPAVRPRMEAVLRELESYGYRPRIQEAWRSPKDQLAAYNAGTSKVKYGFHNVTAMDGTKEALAADVWDDDHPTNTKTHFMLHLLAAAEKNGLTTGIRWSLSDNHIQLIEDAIAKQDWKRPVWVGWDPLHVEATGITIQEAEAGKRPEMPSADTTSGGTQQTPDNSTVPTPDDTTGDPPKYEPESIQYRVENLETGQTQDYELTTALRPVTLLSVPYISQLGPGADSRHNDCGAAAVAMVLAAYTGAFITPDEFYDKFNITGDPFLTADHVRNALGSKGITTDFKSSLEFKDLFSYLLSDIPIIIPTNYSVLHDAGLTENTFAGPHFSVVVGMDLKNIYVHDPLFTKPEDGDARAYPLDIFLKAWTNTPLISGYAIPQRSAIIPTSPIGAQTVNVKRIRVTASSLNVRQGPGTNYPVVDGVTMGQEYNLLSETNGWGEIAPNHWISLSYTVTIPSVPSQPPTPPASGSDNPGNGGTQGPGQGILFNINLATSVPQNPTGTRAAEYLFNDPLIPSTQRNLCGDIALSMVYETVTNKQNTLGYIYQGSRNTTRLPNGGTNAFEYAQQFAGTFPAGWKAYTYYLSYLYYFEAGNLHYLKESPGALSKSLTSKSTAEIKSMLTQMLSDHTYVIAGVSQSTLMEGPGAARLNPKGVGHWVVVIGVSDEYIYVNNPFMNRRETYKWDEFMQSFGYWILQIFPPSSYQPQVYVGPMDQVHASLEQDRNKA
jgi:predicted double-glycine peptidase